MSTHWIRHLSAFLATLSLFYVSGAHYARSSGGHFSIFLAPNLSTNRVANRNPKVINSYGMGFESGFAYEKFIIGETVGIEPGITYLVRTFRVDTPIQQIETTLPAVEIPLQLRLHFTDFLSVGGGGYFAYGIGPAEQTKWPVNGPADTKRGSYNDIGFKTLDYGFVANARGAFSIVKSTRLFVELRYRHSVVNLSTDSLDNILLKTGSLMGGLQFEF